MKRNVVEIFWTVAAAVLLAFIAAVIVAACAALYPVGVLIEWSVEREMK